MIVMKRKCNWAGHTARSADDRWAKQLFQWYPREIKRMTSTEIGHEYKKSLRCNMAESDGKRNGMEENERYFL